MTSSQKKQKKPAEEEAAAANVTVTKAGKFASDKSLPVTNGTVTNESFAAVFFRILAHSAAVGGVAFFHLRYDSWRFRITSVVVAVVVVAVIVVVVIVVIV